MVRVGKAWVGNVRVGKARIGKARVRKARLGKVRVDKARVGKVWVEKVRVGQCDVRFEVRPPSAAHVISQFPQTRRPSNNHFSCSKCRGNGEVGGGRGGTKTSFRFINCLITNDTKRPDINHGQVQG